jgi:class 3 adenylate cyclase
VGAEDLEAVIDEVARFLTGQSAPSSVGRFLTTVLFTDIVGSTERAIQLGDRRWSELLDTHDDGVRHHLARNRGKEIKTTGDGFLACFGTPSEAIRCALDIADSAQKLGIEIRAGLHSGECEWRGDDIAGVAVHVAARISAIAGPGQVLVSRTVSDLVDGSGLDFSEGGSHQLRGLPGTWELFTAVSESNKQDSANGDAVRENGQPPEPKYWLQV